MTLARSDTSDTPDGCRVDMHVNIPDLNAYCCRLLRKVYDSGCRVLVYAPEPTLLAQLDKMLWTFSPLDFIPHCLDNNILAARTPIVLSIQSPDSVESLNIGKFDVLLSFSLQIASGFTQFSRVLDLSGNDAEQLHHARSRFAAYRQQGITPQHFNAGDSH